MTGRISVTTDINTVYDNISSCKVITVVDVDNITEEIKTISTIASFLLPPYEVISVKLCNEDDNMFKMLYSEYLHDGESIEFIAILYKALLQGENILLYFPTDYELFINELLNIMTDEFGFWFDGDIGLDPRYSACINATLYSYDMISAYDLLQSAISINEIPQHLIWKLHTELFMPYTKMTYDEIIQYIKSLIDSKTMKGPSGRILRNIWRVNNDNIH